MSGTRTVGEVFLDACRNETGVGVKRGDGEGRTVGYVDDMERRGKHRGHSRRISRH